MNEYLEFRDETPAARKTNIIGVYSRSSGDLLGRIKWFGRWRQYVFFPEPGTIWNPECLDAVNAQVRALMALRRSADPS